MEPKRLLGPAAAIVLAVAIGGGIWYSRSDFATEKQNAALARAEAEKHLSLKGLIGSEKEGFFADERVQARLAELGLTVTVDKAGSRAIANRADPKQYDFAFPSGAPAAAQLKETVKARETFVPFYTPIIVASWKPVAEILAANGLASPQAEGYYHLDIGALLPVMEKGARWRELKSSTRFATSKAVLISSTDVRSSNSAGMYLSLVSYLFNNQRVVESEDDLNKVLPAATELFLRQGFQESSSAAPFEDYLALGMGKTPMLIAYESQMVEFWLKHPNRIAGDMVVMYPSPTIYSKHVFVPLNAKGERLGRALQDDAALRSLAHEYGFRTAGDSKGPDVWAQRGIKTPETLVDVIEPPSYEWLERMIQSIEAKFK